jgi:16S rRNA (cytidine1402-2'-O)-methyltransferase
MKPINSTLFLVPVTLGDNLETIPEYAKNICGELDCFIVENLRSARRYLRSVGYKKDFNTEVKFFEFSKNDTQLDALINFFKTEAVGKNIGLLSEAGNPCIADPGALAVKIAHELNWLVRPLVGPSSILMALIASGFNGQNFTFHGYVPLDVKEQGLFLKKAEMDARKTGYTQIFMETPYRNEKLIEQIIKNCSAETMLCIAADISLETEFIETRKLKNWSKNKPDFHKRPAMFLIGVN